MPLPGGEVTTLKHSIAEAMTIPDLEALFPDAQRHESTYATYTQRMRELLDRDENDVVPVAGVNPSGTNATLQPVLSREPRILDRVADTVAALGVAGERRTAQLLFLIVTTRLLERVVSVAVKGPSSAGKSFLVESVLRLFPGAAFHALSAMSERALVYDDEPLAHRMLVLYEAAGLAGDLPTYLVRSLLSEGHVRYTTVEKTKDGIVPRTISREGPTGLITTTTSVRLHPENETRLISLTVADSPEQTKAVLMSIAGGSSQDVELGPWHELQRWLEQRSAKVVIPYLEVLADAIPPVAVRLRRDFAAVVSLIQAHALLHQYNRERSRGSIVATLEDYSVVRELVGDLVADAAEQSVPQTIRETVEAISQGVSSHQEVTVTEAAVLLGIDKSAASRRVRVALQRGYLENLEDRRGRPSRLVLGDPLPEEQTILPEPDELDRLHRCATGRQVTNQ